MRQRVAEALKPRSLSGPGPIESWQLDALNYLEQHPGPDKAGCRLPELFHALRRGHPELSVPAYHDGLMQLRDRGAVELARFDGPLRELPEPEYALLEGATVYFAVRRR